MATVSARGPDSPETVVPPAHSRYSTPAAPTKTVASPSFQVRLMLISFRYPPIWSRLMGGHWHRLVRTSDRQSDEGPALLPGRLAARSVHLLLCGVCPQRGGFGLRHRHLSIASSESVEVPADGAHPDRQEHPIDAVKALEYHPQSLGGDAEDAAGDAQVG